MYIFKRKHICIFVVTLFLIGGFSSSFVFAKESDIDIQSLVAKLQEQIKNLQAQIIELQSQLEAVKAELKFNRTLVRGLQGDDIKQLQEFLKTMPEIYPEGLTTGYFGPLTEAAVRRFQEKQGIESVGFVGPKTIAKLNEIVGAVPVVSATPATPAVPTEQKAIPAVPAIPAQPPFSKFTPPLNNQLQPLSVSSTETVSSSNLGFVSAPNLSSPTTSPSTTNPISITTPTTTTSAPTPSPSLSSDTTPPSVPTGFTAIAYSSTQILLSYTPSTDNVGLAGYKIFRAGTQVGTGTYNGNSYLDTGLQPSTMYVYNVIAYDAAGNNSAQSLNASATTLPQTHSITVAYPNGGQVLGYLSYSFSYNSTSVSKVGFKLFKGSQVVYETTTLGTAGLPLSFSPSPGNPASYQSGSDYKVRIYDWDDPATYDDSDNYFSVDVTPPSVLVVFVSSITANSAVITWTTDEPATGFVNYGSTSTNWAVTPTDTSYTNSHSFTLSNLTSDTLYTYRVYSVDASGNSVAALSNGYPPEYTFTTTSTASSTDLRTKNLAAIGYALESLKAILEELLKFSR